MNVINRHIYKAIREHQTKYPLLAVIGPSYSGKSTLLKTFFHKYRYVSLENPEARDLALKSPNRLLNECKEQVILDEVQQAPTLFSHLLTLMESRPDCMGGFILSDSPYFSNGITYDQGKLEFL